MAEYNLTPKQKQLLSTVTEFVKTGKAKEPLIAGVTNDGGFIIGIPEKFDGNLLGDLEVLCEADLLGFRFNSRGNKIYTIKQSAYNAIENNFVIPNDQIPTQINIGAIIRDINGGNVQAIGFNSNSEVNQIINDPQLLQEKLDTLAEQLIEVVKSELPSKELIAYIQSVNELKKIIQNEKPAPSILHLLFASISFLGDVESTISLAARAWPYVYPLLIIASQKISSGG